MKNWKLALLAVGALALLTACGVKKAATLPMEDGPAVVDTEEQTPSHEEQIDPPDSNGEDAPDAPASTAQPHEQKETEEPEPVRQAVRVNGVLYYATGEPSPLTGRCGTWDGIIETAIPENELPEEDDSSNFGTGYYYQIVAEDSIELDMDGQWMVFRREDICGLPVAAHGEETLPVEPEEPPVQE